MAFASVGVDSVRANPILGASRRHILSALAAIPVAAFPVAAVAVDREPSGDDDMNMHALIQTSAHAQWEHVVNRYREVLARLEAYDAAVYEPVSAEVAQRAGDRPDLVLVDQFGEGVTQAYEVRPSELDALCQDEYWGEQAAALRDAWHRYCDFRADAENAFNLAAVEERHEALMVQATAARQAVILAPVPDMRALAAKLEIVDAEMDLKTGDDLYPDFWACLARDVKGLC